MYRKHLASVLLALVTASAPQLIAEPVLYGSYIEIQSESTTAGLRKVPGLGLSAKTFANRTAGAHRSILFWNIARGSWNGQSLDSLKIVIVIESHGVPGSPLEGAMKAAIYIDEKATTEKAAALLDLARELAPRYLKNVKRIRKAPIQFVKKDHALRLSIRNHLAVDIETHQHDSAAICEAVCGKDPQPGKPLSRHVKSEKALGQKSLYKAEDLDVRWSSTTSQSCLFGQFGL
ncbi:MAG: DUF1326 domain-containing protein [Planctomycetota bacterium]